MLKNRKTRQKSYIKKAVVHIICTFIRIILYFDLVSFCRVFGAFRINGCTIISFAIICPFVTRNLITGYFMASSRQLRKKAIISLLKIKKKKNLEEYGEY